MSTPRTCSKYCECPTLHIKDEGLTKIYSADLELTVQLLVQIDKLVMLIESPVFTCIYIHSFVVSHLNEADEAISLDLRLQLLEPDKYPWLPKCLYGLLMILPQSTAFISLRARLQVVHSSGYVPTNAKT